MSADLKTQIIDLLKTDRDFAREVAKELIKHLCVHATSESVPNYLEDDSGMKEVITATLDLKHSNDAFYAEKDGDHYND